MVLGAGLPLAGGLLYICRQRSPLPEALAHLTLSKPALLPLTPRAFRNKLHFGNQYPAIDLQLMVSGVFSAHLCSAGSLGCCRCWKLSSCRSIFSSSLFYFIFGCTGSALCPRFSSGGMQSLYLWRVGIYQYAIHVEHLWEDGECGDTSSWPRSHETWSLDPAMPLTSCVMSGHLGRMGRGLRCPFLPSVSGSVPSAV